MKLDTTTPHKVSEKFVFTPDSTGNPESFHNHEMEVGARKHPLHLPASLMASGFCSLFESRLFLRFLAALPVFPRGGIGCSLVIVALLAAQPTRADEFPSGVRIGTIEYPAEVTPVMGTDEGVEVVDVVLGESPEDIEIQTARIFAEPLVPIGEVVLEGENAALGRALNAFTTRVEKDDVSALDEFLTIHPESRWKVALQTNIAILRRKAGYFTEALGRLDEAWALGRAATTPEGRSLAYRAVGELADLNARFGRFDRIHQIFQETDALDIPGSAQTLLRGAKEGYWKMTQKPADAFRCGPYAVNAVLDAGKRYVPDPRIARQGSTQRGTNLGQLKTLAAETGLQSLPARRKPGAAWPVPMVVHWKVGHFAAITRQEKGKYLVQDPTFGGEIWVTARALEAEASGYGLVPLQNGGLPVGWVPLSDSEAAGIWGKGGAEVRHPEATTSANEKCKGEKCWGMAGYDMFKMSATLQISDIPMGYRPPFGPAVEFEISYNHLEAGQPGNFTFANFGPFWVCNWIAYAEVDAGDTVILHTRGGGAETYDFSGYDALTSRFQRSLYSGAQLIKAAPSRYEREMPDGSREVYSQVDGATGRIFLKEVLDPHGNKIVLNYTGLRLTSIVDALGQATTIAYKSNSASNAGYYKIASVTDPFNRTALFNYDANWRLIQIQDVIGITSEFTYAADGFITKLTTPYGDTQFYQYVPAEDGTARGLLVILPDGSREVIESYTGHERMTYYWDRKAWAMAPGDRSMSEQTNWLMSTTGHLMMDVPEWRKKAFEGRVEFKYPQQPDPTASPDSEDPPDTLVTYVGAFRKPIQVSRVLDDGSRQIYRYEYNGLGHVTKSVDPAGRTTRYFYAVNNLDLMEVRQKRGENEDLLAKWTYDGKHNPLTFRDASGRLTHYVWNSRGQPVSVTNAKNETTEFIYNASGYLTQIDGPLSGDNDRTEFTWDSYGRPATVTRVEGPAPATDNHTLGFAYDALDRLTLVTYPDNSTEQNVYSRLDRIRSKDRLGRWTQFAYNVLGEVIQMLDPAARVTRYEWCRCGALQGLTDPADNLTKWAYDAQGRLVRKTYADGSFETLDYENTTSRLKKFTDTAGNQTHYTYYIDNSMETLSRTAADGFAAVPSVSLEWDSDYPRLASIGDSNGTYTYLYNPCVSDFYGSPQNGRGRLWKTTNSALSGADLTFEYDELGRMVKRQINGVANEATWFFDAVGRVSSWTNGLGAFTPEYIHATYGVNRPSSVGFPNGQTVAYEWEDKTGDFRLKQIKNTGPGNAALSKFDYISDAVGRITQWKQQRGESGTERLTPGYNPVDELITAVLQEDGSENILKSVHYGYDRAGNRISEQTDTQSGKAMFNELNQLTEQGTAGPTRFKGTLDKSGVVTVNGQAAWMQTPTSFVADVPLPVGNHTVTVVAGNANNVTRTNNYQVVVASGTTSELGYDGAGNLISEGGRTCEWDAAGRLVSVGRAGGSTEYSYDCLGRRVKIVEKDGGGNATSTKQFVFEGLDIAEQRDGNNVVTRRYFAEGWRDEVGGESYYYTKDHLGSIREVVDENGAMVSRYEYDPYGRTTKLSGTVESDMLYTGHYRDMGSGYYLTMYRAYSPELGRWLSRDPIGEAGGINLYAYVGNNPVNATDPFGLYITYGSGSSEFWQNYKAAYNRMRASPSGAKLLDYLESSPWEVNINGLPPWDPDVKGHSGPNFDCNKVTISLDEKYFSGDIFAFDSRWRILPHEFFHAAGQIASGNLAVWARAPILDPAGIGGVSLPGEQGRRAIEFSATRAANKIAREAGDKNPFNTSYPGLGPVPLPGGN